MFSDGQTVHFWPHSVKQQWRFVVRDMTKFWQWNDPKTKFSLALGSFYFRTTRNEKRPLSRERQEHSRNDPHCSGNEDQTVTKEVRTIHDLPSFGPRSSFESHSESFGKERVLRNDAGTRSERGGRVGESGTISPLNTLSQHDITHTF